MGKSGNPARRVQSTGIRVESARKWQAPLPDVQPGRHFWIVTGLWTVNPTSPNLILDYENLVTVDGPGCFICEQLYSPEVAATTCPGDPGLRR